MTSTPILQLVELSKSFGGLKAISSVNYQMAAGELSAIIGPNGAGKTTLFNLMTKYYEVDSGKILFKGINITELRTHDISHLGIARAFQIVNIYPTLSTYENIRQAVLSQQKKCMGLFTPANMLARRETTEILESCGLGEQRDVISGNLSQGDKKRLELAIALGNKPELLFLDEPTAGMSGEESRETMEFVRGLNQKRNITILFTEHDMSVVFAYARRITVLHQGEVIADATPEEVRSNERAQRIYLGEEHDTQG
jgi:branched-chain amino acid transport system ATP-binding protein